MNHSFSISPLKPCFPIQLQDSSPVRWNNRIAYAVAVVIRFQGNVIPRLFLSFPPLSSSTTREERERERERAWERG